MDEKTRSNYIPSIKDSFCLKNTHRFKVKGWQKIFHVSENQKRVGLAVLTPNKIEFKPKMLTKEFIIK